MKRETPKFSARSRQGFSLLECLLLVMVVGIVGAAAGNMLGALAKVPRDSDTQFQLDLSIVSKMETIRGMAWNTIAVGNPATALSDSVQIRGKTYARNVTVAYADVTGDGLAENNVKRITIQMGGMSVSTLVTQP